MQKINYNDNLRIKKSHITHILCRFVILSHAAVGQVRTFCNSWFYENGKKPLCPAWPRCPTFLYSCMSGSTITVARVAPQLQLHEWLHNYSCMSGSTITVAREAPQLQLHEWLHKYSCMSDSTITAAWVAPQYFNRIAYLYIS